MKKIILFFALAITMSSNAQIGYQVALLNKATGEPRSGVTVNADIKIEDSKGGVIYSGSQSATSNDFGILSLTVGNDKTFENADFGNLPFFISVTVDGTLIGKSQILTVPIAEAAKKLVPEVTKEQLVGVWADRNNEWHLAFKSDGTYTYSSTSSTKDYNGKYQIDGNNIHCIHYNPYDDQGFYFILRFIDGALWGLSNKEGNEYYVMTGKFVKSN